LLDSKRTKTSGVEHMKKKLLILLCVTLSLGLMVNGKALNEKKNIVAEDIPYEWRMIDTKNT
jgi:hypothetical protein